MIHQLILVVVAAVLEDEVEVEAEAGDPKPGPEMVMAMESDVEKEVTADHDAEPAFLTALPVLPRCSALALELALGALPAAGVDAAAAVDGGLTLDWL